jgi:putative PEP-CTERM system TPR-repeat lipoprotein
MSRAIRANLWRAAAIAVAIGMVHAAGAAPSGEQTQKWQEFLKKGDLKSAEIELKNAIKAAPKDAALHARLANVYLNLGDNIGAEIEARRARDLHADEAAYLPVLATALLRQAKYDKVIGLITPGDRKPELESVLRMLLGAAHLDLGELAKAEPLLRDAVRLTPNSLPAKFELAQLLVRKNAASPEAAKLVDEILKTWPNSLAALQLKGELAWAHGDTDGALRLFDRVLKAAPNFWPTRMKRAQLNIALNRFAAADADLDPIFKIAPKNLQANYLRALELTKQRKFGQADQILEKIAPYFTSTPDAYYLRGFVKLMLKQNSQAETLLVKYLAQRPDSPAVANLAARAALAQGAPDRAVSYLKPLADKTPDAALLGTLGDAYMVEGKTESAMQEYEKAAKLDPKNTLIKTELGASKVRSGQPGPGLADLEQVYESKNGAEVAGPSLVVSEMHAGHLDKAAEVAAALVKADPKQPVYQTLLGTAKAAQHDYAAAEAAFRAAVNLEPDFGPAADNLAKLYVLMGRKSEAEKVYRDLLAKKPNDETALLRLGAFAVTDRKWDDAIGYFNRARSAAPKDPGPGLRLVDLYLRRKNPTAARAVATELAARFPSNPAIFVAEARAQFAAGDKAAAIDTYRRAHEVAPNSGEVLTGYVDMLMATKDFATAKSVVADALARAPASVPLKIAAIRVAAAADGLDAGVALARGFEKADPKNDAYVLAAGQLYLKAGRPADAMHLIEQAIAARPADDLLRIELSNVYLHHGETAKSEAILADRAKADPKDLRIAAALGDWYIANDRIDPGIAEYSRVLAAEPHSAVALDNLAWLYLQKGDLPKAKGLAEAALKAAPRLGEIKDTLGMILLAQGDTATALTYLNEARDEAPGAPQIKYHLAVALQRAGHNDDARHLLETLLGSDAAFKDRADAEKLLAQLKRG